MTNTHHNSILVSIDTSQGWGEPRPSMDTLALHLAVSSNDSLRKKLLKKKIRSPIKHVTLDEVIILPKYDPESIMFDQMKILQELLKRKMKQEELKREHQQKKVLHVR